MVKKTTSKKTQPSSKKTNGAKPVVVHRKKVKFNWDVRTWNLAPLATLGPVGFFPKGPGTMGSLAALPFAYLLNRISIPLLWAVVFLIFGIGLLAIQQYTQDKDEKDPSCVISDEVVGQMIPFMVIVPDFMHWPMVFLAFALFRFFDIFKFGAVAFWDRRKNPMGVMMDDVSAGIFAGFVIAMLQVMIVEFYVM